MSVASGDRCEYCGSYAHAEADCRDAKSDRRMELLLGCCMFALILPFAFIGMLAGWAWSGLSAGFMFSKDGWAETWRFLRKKMARTPDGP